MQQRFLDRFQAGRVLARELGRYANRPDVLVLALPRGGVPVGYEIARALRAPLDVFLVRKLGVPGHEELAMGAVASGGVRVLNESVVRDLRIPPEVLDQVTDRELQELRRRDHAYRDDRPPPVIDGRIVILVDDGLATGSTMRAAIAALRAQHPSRIVVAVPVGSPDVCEEIGELVDEMHCAITPEPFHAVGLWYEDFSEVSDQEVRDLLERSRHGTPRAVPSGENVTYSDANTGAKSW